MTLICRKFIPIVILFFSLFASAQDRSSWSRIDASKVRNSEIQRKVTLDKYQGFALDPARIRRQLAKAPRRSSRVSGSQVVVFFPDESGEMIPYRILESPVMSKELEARFPNDRSYSGVSTDGSNKRIRFSMNALGLNAIIMGPDHEAQIIEPLTRNKELYRVYRLKDLEYRSDFTCRLEEVGLEKEGLDLQKAVDDLTLRKYRLAVATTGEYSQFHIGQEGASGGTEEEQKEVVMAAISTAITRVNSVFENDLAITLELIPNNDEIIYLDGATDPYSNFNGTAMLGENQDNLDDVIGTASYDVGHVFSTGGGGVATLAGACVTGNKARGVTGSGNPIGDTFYFDFVAHELGHQFGANHSFNGDEENCGGGNRNDPTAVEPGSGSTLMAYAGLCGSQNVQGQSDLYFHTTSIEEIYDNIIGGSGDCAELIPLTTNTSAPVADAGPDFVIPFGTAYVLRGSGSDADDDPISYCWEQVDNQITAVPPSELSVSGALYRSYPPTVEAERYLPKLSTLTQGTVSSTWEVTPGVAREMNFVLTVRDNNAEGGQSDTDELKVTVSDAAGPFVVTSQNTDGLVLDPGSEQSVTWDVAGTDSNGIDVGFVNILLSTDGGQTYSTTLASNVANDGAHVVNLPDSKASRCFIMVEAVGHFFLAVNSASFSIGEFEQNCDPLYTAVDTPIAIPDNDTDGIVSEIDITKDVVIENVEVHLNDLTHTYLGDLTLVLESPSGTEVTLMSRACEDAEDIVDATFIDGGSNLPCDPVSPGITGEVTPLEPLFDFIGENAQGTWKLKVTDGAPADFGTLNDWGIRICSSEPVLSVNNYVFDNFMVYPNPSEGVFRVQFDSNSVADVHITVYDVLGRTMAVREFKNSPFSFDEELDLISIPAGLYILRIQRGNQVSSQKITLR